VVVACEWSGRGRREEGGGRREEDGGRREEESEYSE
jgi:hypothetical protein